MRERQPLAESTIFQLVEKNHKNKKIYNYYIITFRHANYNNFLVNDKCLKIAKGLDKTKIPPGLSYQMVGTGRFELPTSTVSG